MAEHSTDVRPSVEGQLRAVVAALETAARWFREYETAHRAKNTDEARIKADRNRDRADQLERVRAQCLIEDLLDAKFPMQAPFGEEPTVEDVELLKKALVQKGFAAPESIETLGFEYVPWVRRLCRKVLQEPGGRAND